MYNGILLIHQFTPGVAPPPPGPPGGHWRDFPALFVFFFIVVDKIILGGSGGRFFELQLQTFMILGGPWGAEPPRENENKQSMGSPIPVQIFKNVEILQRSTFEKMLKYCPNKAASPTPRFKV